MADIKTKMPASFKALFILSMFMVIFVATAGALTQSKMSGFGIYVWGYTAWLMHKRKISDLVLFYKFILWLNIIAIGCCLIFIASGDDYLKNYVGYSAAYLIAAFLVLLLVDYAIYRYFSNLQQFSISTVVDGSKEDALWEKVSAEIKSGYKVDSLWTRAFADADGDDAKTNARYIKLRVEQLRLDESVKESSAKDDSVKSSFFGFYGNLILLALLIGCVSYVFFGYVFSETDFGRDFSQEKRLKNLAQDTSSVSTVKDIKNELCYVYWDGSAFKIGKTDGDRFKRYVKQYYGVDRLEFALPIETDSYIKENSRKTNANQIDAITGFLNVHWNAIEKLCKLEAK